MIRLYPINIRYSVSLSQRHIDTFEAMWPVKPCGRSSPAITIGSMVDYASQYLWEYGLADLAD